MDRLKPMADAISHRGPDGEGYHVGNDGVGLAHRRLAIIDLESGDQPIGNEDASIQIVFNGEIYNYQELREGLIARGHSLKTHGDTETIVHLYEEHGANVVQKLRGMFAFALWDSNQRNLLLARDRLGQKPLYYALDDEKLLFGSELKSILAYGGIRREVNPRALDDYLAFGFVPGDQSIFSAIGKLSPATTLCLNADEWRIDVQRYWSLSAGADHERSLDEWKQELRVSLKEAVDCHRVSDVPVGSFLSGGLDSSVVTAVLSELAQTPVSTFSIGFEEKKYSELEYARVVADQFHTEHVEAIVTAGAIESLHALTKYYDEPFADSSAIPTMRVAQLASDHVKVVLSGDGGDEGFGGYSRYAHDLREAEMRRKLPKWFRRKVLGPISRIWPKADWLPRPLRAKTRLTNLSLDTAAAYANTLMLCRDPLRRQLLSSSIREAIRDHRPEDRVIDAFGDNDDDPLRGMLAADIAISLPDDFLTKVDRASMAHGLEVRPPLVDHAWMELAWTVPSELKIRDGQTKWLLKKLAEDWLPDGIVHRPKQGFEIPIDEWLRGPLRNVFEQSVLSSTAKIADYLDMRVVRRLYTMHCNRSGRHGNLLWAILVLGAWMECYLTEPLVSAEAPIVPSKLAINQ